jgi:hypothetical protein
MEVHHHPDVHHKRKKFKEYFFEFLMIFLAVAMGFFAESIRENISDREKEKQNIENAINCLASDTLQLQQVIAINHNSRKYIDSLVTLKDKDLATFDNNKKFYQYSMNGLFADVYFKSNDAALQQLKSSGTLRLIKKQPVIDSLMQYELNNRSIKSQEEDCYLFVKNTWSMFETVADQTFWIDKSKFVSDVTFSTVDYKFLDFHPLFITKDKDQLRILFNNAAAMGATIEFYITMLDQQLTYAKSTIKFLQKEYHLGSE